MDAMNCLCGKSQKPATIEAGGSAEWTYLQARMPNGQNVGSVQLLVCPSCGLVYCGLRGQVANVGAQPTNNKTRG